MSRFFSRASVMGGDPNDPFWREEDQRAMPGLQEAAESWWGIKRNQFADGPRVPATLEPVLIESWDGPPKKRPEDPGIATDQASDNPVPSDADVYADSDWDEDKW